MTTTPARRHRYVEAPRGGCLVCRGPKSDPRHKSDNSAAAPIYPPDRWFGPGGSKRFHYFDAELRSLCGKWMLWRDPVEVGVGWGVGEGNANGDCAGCAKKLAKKYPEAVDPDTGRVVSHA